MPNKSASILIRLDPDDKAEAEAIFEEMGLSTSAAVNMFITQVIRTRRIPFEISAARPMTFYEDMTDEQFERDIKQSLSDIRNGNVMPFDECMEHLMKRLRE